MSTYPDLSQLSSNGINFRFYKSGEILKQLEDEMKHYEKVRKKYGNVQETFSKISVGTGFVSVGLSASGVGTSLSGFGIIIGLPLGVLGGLFGAMSAGCGIVSKKLTGKVLKHEQIVSLGREKANTVRDHISKALNDNEISDKEFEKIQKVFSDYENEKVTIRRKMRSENNPKNYEKNLNADFVEELRKLLVAKKH